ncbi:MAG: restriction endonuclease [Planctomycetaceae bacterium]|nr:restriction endonuclease [Planctomycetaceae bacterium]
MPKRTNEFQELVTIIQKSLACLNATITPSAQVPGPTSGKMREIDVLVQTPTGEFSLVVAVEAKDEKRPLDVTKIEAFIGKYRGNGALQVDKVVVVARRGFTSEAQVRADDESIELMTLDEAIDCDWCQFGPRKFTLRLSPMAVGIVFTPELPKQFLEADWENEAEVIRVSDGHRCGTPMKFRNTISRVVINSSAFAEMTDDLKRCGGTGGGDFYITRPLSDYAVRDDGYCHKVTSVTVHVQRVDGSTNMMPSAYRLVDKQGNHSRFIHSHGRVGDQKVEILSPHGVPCATGIIEFGAPSEWIEKDAVHSWALSDEDWDKVQAYLASDG